MMCGTVLLYIAIQLSLKKNHVDLLLNGPIWVEDNNQNLSADKTTIK